jgi:hypothetical protein
MVNLFLYPSDWIQKITNTDGFAGAPDRDFAPTNYPFCADDGANGGDLTNPDGEDSRQRRSGHWSVEVCGIPVWSGLVPRSVTVFHGSKIFVDFTDMRHRYATTYTHATT